MPRPARSHRHSHRHAHWHAHRHANALAYAAFLAGPLLLYAAAFIWPVLATIDLSRYSWDGFSPERTYVGLANYVSLLGERRFLGAVLNNGKWLAYYLLVPTVVGLGLAVLLDADFRGVTVFRTIFFIPFTITTVAIAATWRWLYEPNAGVINSVLRAAGLGEAAQNWLGNPNVNTYAIMLASLWAWSGFTFLVYFGGLRNIPTELTEAARIDGASAWTVLWRIKLPMLLPSTVVVLGIAGVDSMRVFDLIWAMTQGGPFQSSTVLAVEMYETSFARFELGTGAAVAVYLLALSALVVLPYLYVISSRTEEQRE